MADDPYVLLGNEILCRPDGSRRPREEAVRLVGHRAVWMAELSEEVAKRLSGPPPLSVPPRVFLSYRWSTPERDAWVEDLARQLELRGYRVTFDRWVELEANPPTVPELVARIADANVFLAIIDHGYLERIGTAEAKSILDGWVFDEYDTAVRLNQAHRLTVFGFLREACDLPRGFRQATDDKPGNLIDVRAGEQLQRALDVLFPEVEPPPADTVAEVEDRITMSYQALTEGRLDQAARFADEAVQRMPDIPDGHIQRARVAEQANDPDTALAASLRALELAPRSVEMLSLAAQCAWMKEEPKLAVNLGAQALEFAPHDAAAHYALGNALDDSGQVFSGIVHLEIARAKKPGDPLYHNNTCIAYRHAGNPARAIDCVRTALLIDPTNALFLINLAASGVEAGDPEAAREGLAGLSRRHRGHKSIAFLTRALETWQSEGGDPPAFMPQVPARPRIATIRCSECPCEIPVVSEKEMLCARCGSELLDRKPSCAFCDTHDVAVPKDSPLCPFCREGTLSLAKHDER